MNTERAEQIYNIYYYRQKDPFGINSRSFYKIRNRLLTRGILCLFFRKKQDNARYCFWTGNIDVVFSQSLSKPEDHLYRYESRGIWVTSVPIQVSGYWI